MIQKIFNNKILSSKPMESVAVAGIVLTLAQIVSNIMGLFRDRFLASTFGAGDTLDIYYAAFRFPDLIYNLLILGALSAAFIPVFTGLINDDKNKEEAWKLASDMMNLAIFAIIIFSTILVIFAPWLMKLVAPGFSPEKMNTAVMFTRIMFLSPLFLGISGIMGGVLTSMKHFLIYSIAPLLYNAGIIFGILILTKRMGSIGLAWGVVLGAFLHMLLQYMVVRKLGYKHHWTIFSPWKNKNVKIVLRLMFPRMAGIAINQINLMIITIFASTLAAGSLAILNFSQNLQSVPLSVFGISFAIAAFPTLAAFSAQGEKQKFVKVFSETFRQILFFVIPLSIFMIVLRAQLVRAILGAGKFDWNDTVLTFQCLGFFAISIFAQSAVQLLARSFYAMQDTKTPFYVAMATEAVNILLILALIGRFEVLGLAIAFSVASIVQMMLLLFILRTRFDDLDDRNIIESVVKISGASLLASVAIQLSKSQIGRMIEVDTFLEVLIQLVVPALIGIGVFAVLCEVLKINEFMVFKKSLSRKLFKKYQGQIAIEGADDVNLL
jgi:putative peptidoglycan lipid II flippase